MRLNKIIPLVTVYMPTRSRGFLLRRAIDSVLRQSYENIEFIICDDKSDDNTQEIVEGYSRIDSRVIYKPNDTVNSGACVARNICIASANGDFITGIDDDDEFLENRIELFLKNWSDNYAFICANFYNIYGSRVKIPQYFSLRNNFVLDDLLIKNEASNQIFTKTDRLKFVGGFDESVRRLQDWDTWIRMCSEFGGFHRMVKPTYKMYHSHKKIHSSVSNNIPYSVALDELISRNEKLYSLEKFKQLKRMSKFESSSYGFFDMLEEVKFNKSLLPVVRIAKRKLIDDIFLNRK